MKIARGTQDWVLLEDPPLGHSWALEYAMFCLGHGFAVAGGLATQYRLGHAHRDFEDLRNKPAAPLVPRTKTRSITSG